METNLSLLNFSIPILSIMGADYFGGAKRDSTPTRYGKDRSEKGGPDGARWGEPTLYVQAVANQHFSFQLRSRVNVPLMVGGPIPMEGELEDIARRILTLCAQENSMRVDTVSAGFTLSVIDAEANVIGRSEVVATEAFALVMKRLIAVQALRAQIVLQPAMPA